MKTIVGVLLCCFLTTPEPRTDRDVELIETMARAIPPRPHDALSGTEFTALMEDLTGPARESAIVEQLRIGNIPSFLRQLQPVPIDYWDKRGRGHRATIWVMPDYLAIGSDEDFLRVPMGLDTARTVARQYGFMLPTRKIVDNIYLHSSLKLTPQPMKPGPRMTSTSYYAEHNRRIEAQRQGRPLGELVSGHKKDVILTKRLLTRRGRVAIYGWHQRAGQPIQPLSTVHGARYADYSHGVRLVSATVFIDGAPRSIFEVLRDPALAYTLTYEGKIRDAAKLLGY